MVDLPLLDRAVSAYWCATGTHHWPGDDLDRHRRGLARVIDMLQEVDGWTPPKEVAPVTAGEIRQWASSAGKDPQGRTLYPVREAEAITPWEESP